MKRHRWYEFSVYEVIGLTVMLVALMFFYGGPPKGWGWIGLPIGLLAGRAAWSFTKWAHAKMTR